MSNPLHHANFFSTSQSLCCIVGFEGSFRQVNQAALDALGYRLEEMLHFSFIELVHAEHRQRIEILLETLSEGEAPMTFNAPICCKDGSCRDFLWQATPSLMEFAFYAVGVDASVYKQDMQQETIATLREEQVILQEKYADLQLMYEELQSSVGGGDAAEHTRHYPAVVDLMQEGAALQGKNGKLHLLNAQRIQDMIGEPLGLSDFMMLWQTAIHKGENAPEPAIHVLRKNDHPIYLQCRARVLKDPKTQATQARLLVFQNMSKEISLSQQLHTLQDDMASITQTQKEGIINWDLRQGRLDYSASWKTMLGIAEQEHLGRNENAWFSRIHPNDYKQVSSEIKQFIKIQNGKLDLKYRMQHKDGSYRWIRNSGRLIPEGGSKAERLISVFLDVTEQQQVEQTLRSTQLQAEKEAFYHYLFAAQGEATLVFTQEEWRVIDINPVALQLYGYSREEWQDSNLDKIYADPAQCIADVQHATQQKYTQIPLSWHKRKNGTLFPAEIALGRFELRGQKLLYAAIRDVTERHMREQTLREERNQYGTIFHAAPLMILFVDRNQQVLRANRYAAKILNSRPDILEGQYLRQLKLAYDINDEKLDAEVLSTGQARLAQMKEIDTQRWQIHRLPYRDAAGNVMGIILFMMEVVVASH